MAKRGADIRIERVFDTPDKADGPRVLAERLWPRGFSVFRDSLLAPAAKCESAGRAGSA